MPDVPPLDQPQSDHDGQPEQPAEPKTEEVDTFQITFYSSSRSSGVVKDICDSVEVKECGVVATECASGDSYACVSGVIYKGIKQTREAK